MTSHRGQPVIRLAHSPDSDDAFMFYGLASGLVDTDGIRYEHDLQDIETLNQRAFRGELEVTAVSIHAYAYLSHLYALLPHGASMGDGYGPRLVAKRPIRPAEIRGRRIAVPGRFTSAYLALRLFERDFEAVFLAFDAIEDAVINDEVDAGLLIHEGQLTYAQKGLHLITDLGEWWGSATGLPLPLGGNVIRKDLDDRLKRKVSRHLRESIRYGLKHRHAALSHSMQYARGLEPSQADEFVGMYVNDWTLGYGARGREAILRFLNRGFDAGVIPHRVNVEFIDD